MWSTTSLRLIGAAAALVLLAGCSTTIAGIPTAAGRDATSTSSDPTPTTETSGQTGTSESDPGTGELNCEGDNVVAPEGQPFCFDVPEGFTPDEVTIDNQAGSAASYSTGLSLTPRDLIVISVYELSLDSDDLSDRELIDALSAVIEQLAEQGFDFTATEPQVREVDGARAFYYTGNDATGLFSDTYFIFRGRTELQVNCQWETMMTEVLKGCDDIRASLQISG